LLSARTRFAFAGFALALLVALAAPALAHATPIGMEAAVFAILSVSLVGLGVALGGRFDALERHSLEDPVTRVGNRRHWEARLTEELERAVQSRMPLSVLMLDLDNLKRLNDAEGHGCGDRALALIGEVLLATCRSRDVAARLGGDEFALALPRTRASEAKIVAERIRTELARRRVELGAPTDQLLTVSIGIADLDGVERAHSTSLVESADHALYLAKENGRDRIEVTTTTWERRHPAGIIRLDERRLGRKGGRVTA
jgi:diguanylate cyclase (GGDEF)-like protein